MDYKKIIRDVPDFPQKGIIFKDLTTLWKDASALRSSIDEFARRYKDRKIDKVIGAESRGFIIGAPLAYILNAGFVPVRKKGKLPAETIARSYTLEYGQATLEMHKDAINPGEKVLIVDDLLATGGTMDAIIGLTEASGGEIIECAFWIELEFLKGRDKIKYPVFSLIKY